jgi:serine/threonine-protein kinase HipA
MVDRAKAANVRIWGKSAGVIVWEAERGFASFEYEPGFLDLGLDLSPLRMPVERARSGRPVFAFPNLPPETFMGLPGMLADSLPDNFGNRIIDQWLASRGRSTDDFSPVERLCYTGSRGMGALEFGPVISAPLDRSVNVEVEELVELARQVVEDRGGFMADIGKDPGGAMLDIIRVGTSAGGNRPKAVIALNDATREIRSGQVAAPAGFDYWILKFDGVKDQSLRDPAGYGRIEYAYSHMARSAGITMAKCRLLEEGGRAHFMTRRFDRLAGGEKLHMHSLCGMAHFDFNSPGSSSYEEAFQVMRELRLPYGDAEQQYRRMVFNVIARNQDDHTKNIAFIMDRKGRWRLSPAFDLTWAYNPTGRFTSSHQMTIGGKRDGFTFEDLAAVGREMSIKSCESIIGEIVDAVSGWPSFAKEAGVPQDRIEAVAGTHRLDLK